MRRAGGSRRTLPVARPRTGDRRTYSRRARRAASGDPVASLFGRLGTATALHRKRETLADRGRIGRLTAAMERQALGFLRY
ncbi:hypothetical protein DF037_28955 [Burkholderia contaminans]|uniref:Uncharacterized protein n=1 Tax=Burkholderia contaminans TaxID=488447 RepID=A0A3N8QEB0_9BURK|nr:hypothetical protein DF037_28955 [Burkholderia contaminans]